MAEVIKVLGQVIPTGATLTPLYTVPASTSTVVSTITVCNQGIATTFRLSVAVAGAADTPKQYLCFDVSLAATESRSFTLGMTLGAADVVRVQAGTSTVSFNAFGAETS